jgi:hypothetical protein
MGGFGGRPLADGAAGIVWAATLRNEGPTGGFFRDGKRCCGETQLWECEPKLVAPKCRLNLQTPDKYMDFV